MRSRFSEKVVSEMGWQIVASIDTDEWERLYDAVRGAFIEKQDAIIERGATQAMVTLDQLIRRTLPPPVRKQKASPYWTEKQRRWWWWTVNQLALGSSEAKFALPGWSARFTRIAGRKRLVLSGSYKRTNVLINSIGFRIQRTGDGQTLGIIGANVDNPPRRSDYAAYVLDKKLQATYHKGNWATLEGMLQASLKRMTRVYGNTIAEAIREEIDRAST